MSLRAPAGRSKRAALTAFVVGAAALAGAGALSGPVASGATTAPVTDKAGLDQDLAEGKMAAKQQAANNRLNVQILSFNDFHGHLEATDGPLSKTLDPSQTPVGGVEYLATHLARLEADQPQSTLTVAAGDLIGGSTFLSGIFQDQPAIEALNELGLDVSSVGNHEFDEGTDELLRMVNGGCHPEIGCFEDLDGKEIPYGGTDFDYLAANVVDQQTREPFLPGTSVQTVDGVKVGFIGMTLEATRTLVNPAGVASVDFLDEIQTANAQAETLKQQGVKAIVVLMHEGGYQSGTFDQCVGISGPVVDISQNLDPEIDMVVTGHTHQPYICNVPDPEGQPRLVTSAASFGQVITETHLVLNKRSGQVMRDQVTATNHLVSRDVAKDAGETEILEFWQAISAPVAGEVVGTLAPDTDITGDSSTCRCEETPMVDLVADSILWGTEAPEDGGAQVAFMNTGGVRASLLYDEISNNEQPGEITLAEAYDVAPFNNILVSMDLTGQQVVDVLNQQYQPIAARGSRPMLSLGVSEGFTYEWIWDGPAPLPGKQPGPGANGHVKADSAMLNGVPLDMSATYRVATLNFLQGGGDSFTAFQQGANVLGGPEDLANLADYMRANPGLTPPPDRVTGL